MGMGCPVKSRKTDPRKQRKMIRISKKAKMKMADVSSGDGKVGVGREVLRERESEVFGLSRV